MNTNIIKIGNSKGIIIPTEILKKMNLTHKSSVSIQIKDESIIIKAQPRQGWEEEAKKLHACGGDELIIPDVFEDEQFDEWVW